MGKILRAALISAALAGSSALAGPATAAAADQASVDNYTVCYKDSDCNMGYSVGTLSWSRNPLDPTASSVDVDGQVINRTPSDYSTTVVFEGTQCGTPKNYSVD
ncbi:hypothetical protein [Nonomuraea longicatena]|uniref:Uncharacterized protein n=1 Tax=Nonomuraea longicatena TaxID=83682 RepID=A0ABP4A474_9ACTN